MSYKTFKQIMNENDTLLRMCPPRNTLHNCEYGDKLYLYERNYGALEKDDRIDYISQKIKTDIVKRLNKQFLEGKLELSTYTKYKSDDNIDININWNIKTTQVEMRRSSICSSASTSFDNKTNTIYMSFNCINDTTPTKYIHQLREFFMSDNCDIEIAHEVKHILDRIDQVFTKSKYYTVDENNLSVDQIRKYVSQKKEIHNFIITLIKDLKNIRTKYPKITYHKAIQKSKLYYDITRRLDQNYTNKINTKLSYFWLSGEPSVNDIEED